MQHKPVSESLKRDPDKLFILNYAPIFFDLTTPEKDIVIQKSKVVECKKGDIIYKQQDSPDAFYCMISGRVRVFMARDHKKETLEYLNCGKYFGIISLLTDEPHSVSAEAVNDSKILRISKEDFKNILKEIPKLAIHLSLTLSRRLRKKDLAQKKIFESNILSVFSTSSNLSRTIYAVNLALSLKKETNKNIILVDVSQEATEICDLLDISTPQELPEKKYPVVALNTSLPTEDIIENAILKEQISEISILNVKHDVSNHSYPANLNALLTYLTGHYHYVLVNLATTMDGIAFQTLNQSDIIHIITDCDEGSLGITKSLISDLFQKVNYPQERIKIIIDSKKENVCLPYEEEIKILGYKIYATLPLAEKGSGRIVLAKPNSEYARIIRRITREIGDVRVGLALSGGAAYGLTHIGIIKVLEKEGIHIDMVAGSSMGALVGALWASGLTGKQMERIMMEYNYKKKKVLAMLFDVHFPLLSFARGSRIRAFLEKFLKDKTFQDIVFPFKIVACNINKRQEFIYESGKLIDAVMASIAIPGVFEPTRQNSDLIIDGGIIEPVPIGTLIKSGIKKVIAVHVLPSPESITQSYEADHKRRREEKAAAYKKGIFARIKYNFVVWLRKKFFPNILDIIVNSIQTTEYVIAEEDCQRADVVIRPEISGVEWYEFFKVETLIKKGEEEARKCIGAIKSLVSE